MCVCVVVVAAGDGDDSRCMGGGRALCEEGVSCHLHTGDQACDECRGGYTSHVLYVCVMQVTWAGGDI